MSWLHDKQCEHVFDEAHVLIADLPQGLAEFKSGGSIFKRYWRSCAILEDLIRIQELRSGSEFRMWSSLGKSMNTTRRYQKLGLEIDVQRSSLFFLSRYLLGQYKYQEKMLPYHKRGATRQVGDRSMKFLSLAGMERRCICFSIRLAA